MTRDAEHAGHDLYLALQICDPWVRAANQKWPSKSGFTTGKFATHDPPLATCDSWLRGVTNRYSTLINHDLGHLKSRIVSDKLRVVSLPVMTCGLESCTWLAHTYLTNNKSGVWDKNCVLLVPSNESRLMAAYCLHTQWPSNANRQHYETWSSLVQAYLKHLIHCGLVTPYGDRDLGQHWLR